MKILRFIGMAVIAVIMSVNFVACSDDDEDIDTAQLEGTWGLTNDEGYEVYEGEKKAGMTNMTLLIQYLIVKR